ncbi:protein phosphatase regulator [Umbelopsis nana]
MADHDQLIAQLMSMADLSEDKAKFYLEMNNWDINAAASQYFDPSGEDDSNLTSELADEPMSAQVDTSAAGQSSGRGQPKQKRVATLSDFNNDDSEQKDDEPQSFFAGGEKSGMLVEAPRKEGKEKSNIVDDILKKAAEGGAPSQDENVPDKPRYFAGSGYKLGSDEEPSVQVTSSSQSDEPQSSVPVTRQLTFWRNGFSIADGPLLRYDDPANEYALNAINSGRAPLSLLDVQPGQAVDVRVAKRLDEDYTPPPKAPPKPFEGAGHRLGSPSPEVMSRTSSPASQPQAPRPTQLNIDSSQPVTSVQIRLSDGTRLVAKFNHTHTIADIRNFINASRPGEANRAYVLRSSFPPKPLSDESLTLADAGLLNSVVVQTNQ